MCWGIHVVTESDRMTSYLERYNSGEYKAVWKELIELKDGILEPDIYDDATQVARTTMKRVRYNVEMLYDKLIELKYEFAYPKTAFIRAISDEKQGHIGKAEELIHRIPLSVRMWYEEVGEVWFIGEHPLLSSENPRDNSTITSLPFCCAFYELVPGYLRPEEVDDEFYDTTVLNFSPDFAAKHGYSGALDAVYLAANPMDAEVIIDKGIFFVDYLRENFFWGGFPGFKYKQEKFPLIELSYLTEGLLEF